jgi:hypothetical protein
MQIEVRGRNVDPGTSLARHTERALFQALASHADHVNHVLVRFVDVNGPRGGVDKRCLVRLQVRRQGNIVVDERSADWYAAASEAARRAGEALDRLVERKRARGEVPRPWTRHLTDGDLLHA